MGRWSIEQAKTWYAGQPWLVGCNFLPSSAAGQLEMWQSGTFDATTIDRELGWARGLGLNCVRVYLHDLLWEVDRSGFCERVDRFLGMAAGHGLRSLLVFFDDCHRPDPVAGDQPLPVWGVHNSRWNQSPGRAVVERISAGGESAQRELSRLEGYVRGVLERFGGDERVLMWDVYNEPGQSELGETSTALLEAVWGWAWSVRPAQPLTGCLHGSVGGQNLALNGRNSDVLTFHCYDGAVLSRTIDEARAVDPGRPVICTEYMARERGTTFGFALPVLRAAGIGAIHWGHVVGRSQTHFNWGTRRELAARIAEGRLLRPGDPLPEPALWFHDVLRPDGTPYDAWEVALLRAMTAAAGAVG